MGSQINDLVKMGDVETLYELMTEDEDWMTQLDAAEGLVKLGDRRGLDFLFSAEQSEEKDIRQVAKEILDSPEVAQKREYLEAEEKREHQTKIEAAKKRLGKGQKVFRYKMIFLSSSDILDEDLAGKGFDVPALTEHGFEGWEVVNIIPRRRQILTGAVDDTFTGAYFLLKKEMNPEETSELDEA
ncbi:MAG: hypothetical protein M1282_16765 [Chloroflexi bacterium]|nr:hypothetical protein [Chloroflexota bacterium]